MKNVKPAANAVISNCRTALRRTPFSVAIPMAPPIKRDEIAAMMIDQIATDPALVKRYGNKGRSAPNIKLGRDQRAGFRAEFSLLVSIP